MMRRNASWNLLIALLGLLTFLAGILVAHRSLLAAAALLGAIETARRLVRRYREVCRKESETAELHARIERLEQKRARLEGILEAQPDPVVAVDQAKRVIFGNGPARALFGGPNGAGEDSLLGRPAQEALRDRSVVALITKAIAEGKTATGAIGIGDSPETIYHVTATPVLRDGEAIGAVSVFHDQTALRRLERIRSDFVANVSHELRTPLTAVHGFIETLQDGSYKDPARTLRYLDIMHAETTRLTALISDLLHLSKLESPERALSMEPVDMVNVAREVVELFRRPAEAKGLTLDLEAAPHVPAVRADAALIRRALLNLVDNAIKYTEAKGSVRVKVERDPIGVRVSVSDTGVGIPPGSLGRVFERFYRVDKARSRKEGGTGLGLSIVKHTVESHKGKLDIESQLGKGTTIWFSLPV